MGQTTGIEWAHHTFNPWLGCTKVSPACSNCYAESNRAVAAASKRVGMPLWGPGSARVVTSDNYWSQPLKWNRDAANAGERRRVFCASLADVFEERRDLEGPRARLFQLIVKTPNLDWLLLTKRPLSVLRVPGGLEIAARFNVWIGATVEDQERADERIPQLLAIPAVVRFLSCEPLLGPVSLKWEWLANLPASMSCGLDGNSVNRERGIHWVIVGGESGSNARPMHPEWASKLRDDCKKYGVPYFFKQWGEWAPETVQTFLHKEDAGKLVESNCIASTNPEHVGRTFQALPSTANDAPGFMDIMRRVGKKRAGSLLDGVEHKAVPS